MVQRQCFEKDGGFLPGGKGTRYRSGEEILLASADGEGTNRGEGSSQSSAGAEEPGMGEDRQLPPENRVRFPDCDRGCGASCPGYQWAVQVSWWWSLAT